MEYFKLKTHKGDVNGLQVLGEPEVLVMANKGSQDRQLAQAALYVLQDLVLGLYEHEDTSQWVHIKTSVPSIETLSLMGFTEKVGYVHANSTDERFPKPRKGWKILKRYAHEWILTDIPDEYAKRAALRHSIMADMLGGIGYKIYTHPNDNVLATVIERLEMDPAKAVEARDRAIHAATAKRENWERSARIQEVPEITSIELELKGLGTMLPLHELREGQNVWTWDPRGRFAGIQPWLPDNERNLKMWGSLAGRGFRITLS